MNETRNDNRRDGTRPGALKGNWGAGSRNSASQPGGRAEAKPTQSVYGVYGLTEWDMLLPVGNARLRLHFTGGSLSSMGVVPALYVCHSVHLKMLIEESEYFKKGRIVLLK